MSMPKVMTIAHRGGEYVSVDISGLADNYNEVVKILEESRKEIIKPSTTKLIGLHLYKTKITPEILKAVTGWLESVNGKARKIAIIGLTFFGKLKFDRKKIRQKSGISIKYFFDIDQSKDWLLGKLSG